MAASLARLAAAGTRGAVRVGRAADSVHSAAGKVGKLAERGTKAAEAAEFIAGRLGPRATGRFVRYDLAGTGEGAGAGPGGVAMPAVHIEALRFPAECRCRPDPVRSGGAAEDIFHCYSCKSVGHQIFSDENEGGVAAPAAAPAAARKSRGKSRAPSKGASAAAAKKGAASGHRRSHSPSPSGNRAGAGAGAPAPPLPRGRRGASLVRTVGLKPLAALPGSRAGSVKPKGGKKPGKKYENDSNYENEDESNNNSNGSSGGGLRRFTRKLRKHK
jgi:hypothetical protein